MPTLPLTSSNAARLLQIVITSLGGPGSGPHSGYIVNSRDATTGEISTASRHATLEEAKTQADKLTTSSGRQHHVFDVKNRQVVHSSTLQLRASGGPGSGPHGGEKQPSRGDHWQSQVDELDQMKAPDHAYRDILSTGGKANLKKGETWRERVVKYIQISNENDKLRGLGGPGSGPHASQIAREASAKANASGSKFDHTLAAIAHTTASEIYAKEGNTVAMSSHQRHADFHQHQAREQRAAEALMGTLELLEEAVENDDSATVDQLLGLTNGPHSFATTQIDLPPEIAERMFDLGDSIPDSDLADEGRETDPHITVCYGIHSDDPGPVQSLLIGQGPIFATLGETDFFETPDYDVLYVRVVSPDLVRLNALVSDTLEVTDTQTTYQPHATIAYLKSGLGPTYAGRTNIAGQTVNATAVTFCSADGDPVEISLA